MLSTIFDFLPSQGPQLGIVFTLCALKKSFGKIIIQYSNIFIKLAIG